MSEAWDIVFSHTPGKLIPKADCSTFSAGEVQTKPRVRVARALWPSESGLQQVQHGHHSISPVGKWQQASTASPPAQALAVFGFGHKKSGS